MGHRPVFGGAREADRPGWGKKSASSAQGRSAKCPGNGQIGANCQKNGNFSPGRQKPVFARDVRSLAGTLSTASLACRTNQNQLVLTVWEGGPINRSSTTGCGRRDGGRRAVSGFSPFHDFGVVTSRLRRRAEKCRLSAKFESLWFSLLFDRLKRRKRNVDGGVLAGLWFREVLRGFAGLEAENDFGGSTLLWKDLIA